MKEWNLKEMFASQEELEKAFKESEETIKQIPSFQGKLNNGENINNYYQFIEGFFKKLMVIMGYVSLNYSLNQKDLTNQQNMGRLQNLFMSYSSTASFVDNELLANPYENYVSWAKDYKKINDNLFQLKKLFDSRSHVLLPAEEKIIANFAPLTGSYSSIYAMMESADAKPVKITLDGKEISITKNNYTSLLSNEDKQENRKAIFEAYFRHYDEFRNTYASLYKGVVDADIAHMTNRGYKDMLSAYLDKNNIPQDVYLSLINTVRSHTKALQKYIKLRQKTFGFKEYHTYDRFVSFSKAKVAYPYEKAYNDVMDALNFMGEDFVNHAKIALAEGHVDVYPKEGKRSGAFSSFTHGYGPYILLNHTDTLDSAFTLAHECGHSIHSLYASENNCFENEDYEIFVAEIASTFNEQIFLDYLLQHSDNRELKIQALEQQLDGMVSTFFRQTLFADFEYQAHEKAVNGETLTYETLNSIMEDLYRTYYDIDLNTEPLKKYVWAYIPHIFNSPFYVYQYATCLSCAMKIYADVKNGVPQAKEKYLNMLKSGGNDYPMEIVKRGGVDLTKPDAFIAVCEKLDVMTDELEKLLNE